MAVRKCGTCSECCYLNAVPPLDKGANELCEHQSRRTQGSCAIYEKRPKCCAVFSCAWLEGIQPKHMKPNKTGAVVWAITLDMISGERITCVQVSARKGKLLNAEVRTWVIQLSRTVLVEILQGQTRTLYQQGEKLLTWNERDLFQADALNGQLVNLRVTPRDAVLATDHARRL